MTCLKQGIKAVKLTSVMRAFPDEHLTSRCSGLRVAKYKSPTVPLSSHRLPHPSNGSENPLATSEQLYSTCDLTPVTLCVFPAQCYCQRINVSGEFEGVVAAGTATSRRFLLQEGKGGRVSV